MKQHCNQHSCCTSDPVSTGMGDRLRACKPSWCVISHSDCNSLAITPCVGAASTSESWGEDTLHTLTVPRTHNRLGDRSFAVAGPSLWNSLPISLRQISSLDI